MRKHNRVEDSAVTDETTIPLATLRFDGRRFRNHALDVECTQELIGYRNLILECAKELWHKKHPDRERLPKGFEDGFRIEFDRIENGSATIPLRRVLSSPQGGLDWGTLDEFDEAAELIDAAISAANTDRLLPAEFPANIIPLFREFGKTLAVDEVLFTKSRHAEAEATYDAKARKCLADWVGPTYEDVVDVVGEVRMANVGQGAFSLLIAETGALVPGRFLPAQEDLVLEALRDHREARMRVNGVGEFGTTDRALKRFVKIESVALPLDEKSSYDTTAIPIWEQLASLGESAPAGTWDAVPTDLSTRIDDYIYRRKEIKE